MQGRAAADRQKAGIRIGRMQLAFWALLIGGAIYLFRTYGPRSGTDQSVVGTPERILAERYARGEIDDEEYRRRIGTLRGAHS